MSMLNYINVSLIIIKERYDEELLSSKDSNFINKNIYNLSDLFIESGQK